MNSLKRSYEEAKRHAIEAYGSVEEGNKLAQIKGEWRDIWLDWRTSWPDSRAPVLEAVLVMQDWGDEHDIEPNPADAVSWLHNAFNESESCSDLTVRNLITYCESPIRSGRLLVMNAVWGVRSTITKSDRCGYLGDYIHKLAFPVWSGFLAEIGRIQNNPLTLYLAGAWAKWDDQRFGCAVNASDYFHRWASWTNAPPPKWASKTAVELVPHPCTWNLRLPKMLKSD